jgi:hypothetical protein
MKCSPTSTDLHPMVCIVRWTDRMTRALRGDVGLFLGRE